MESRKSTLGESSPSQPLLAQRLAGTSVWSIDLAYLLRDYRVQVEYLTTAPPTIVAADYSGSDFYAPSIAADTLRVNRLLCAAASESVPVSRRTLSATELWNLMSEEETLVITYTLVFVSGL